MKLHRQLKVSFIVVTGGQANPVKLTHNNYIQLDFYSFNLFVPCALQGAPTIK